MVGERHRREYADTAAAPSSQPASAYCEPLCQTVSMMSGGRTAVRAAWLRVRSVDFDLVRSAGIDGKENELALSNCSSRASSCKPPTNREAQ